MIPNRKALFTVRNHIFKYLIIMLNLKLQDILQDKARCHK